MTTPPITPANIARKKPIRLWIEELKVGNRFCIQCGQINIPPDAPEYVVRCTDCYGNREEPKFCRHCGSDLEKDRIDFAKSQGNECKQCRNCSKKLTEPCDSCGTKHPEYWDCHYAV